MNAQWAMMVANAYHAYDRDGGEKKGIVHAGLWLLGLWLTLLDTGWYGL